MFTTPEDGPLPDEMVITPLVPLPAGPVPMVKAPLLVGPVPVSTVITPLAPDDEVPDRMVMAPPVPLLLFGPAVIEMVPAVVVDVPAVMEMAPTLMASPVVSDRFPLATVELLLPDPIEIAPLREFPNPDVIDMAPPPLELATVSIVIAPDTEALAPEATVTLPPTPA